MKKRIFVGIIAIFLLVVFSGIIGCEISEESVKTINLDEPKASGGILVKDPDTGEFNKIVDMLEAQKEQSLQIEKSSSAQLDSVEEPEENISEETLLSHSHWPQGSGKLFDLPKLNQS